MDGHVALIVQRIGAHSILVEKADRKRLLGRPRRGWEDNSEMDL
jgi:hypothetical protein